MGVEKPEWFDFETLPQPGPKEPAVAGQGQGAPEWGGRGRGPFLSTHDVTTNDQPEQEGSNADFPQILPYANR